MTTRRRFLAANLAGATGAVLFPEALSAAAPSSPSPPRLPDKASGGERDFWNDWPAYIAKRMNEARAHREAQLAQIGSAAQVQARSSKTRETLWSILGGQPEKTPLNAKITHTRDRGYCRIDTLIFESIPGVFVTGNLYRPSTGAAPYPAILCPVGHADNGKAYASYQHFFQNLARQGYIVLSYDPWGQGERFQYIDSKTGRSRFDPTGEHSQAGRPMILLGDGVARYLAWDGVRALDYLLSRSDVDPNRIGCSGHSGGGTMTMYLCCLEPRIHAAVSSEGNFENLAGPGFDPPGSIDDAEQNIVGSLPLGLDRGDLLGAFAPKPLRMCYTTNDAGETYSPVYIEATEEVFRELQRLYDLHGKTDLVSLFENHLPHDLDYFNRMAAYKWFNHWLRNGAETPEESELDIFPEELLHATESGQVLSTPGCRSAVQVNRDRMREVLPASPYLAASVNAEQIRTDLRETLRSCLALPKEKSPLNARVLSTSVRKRLAMEEIEFDSEPGIRITGWFLEPAAGGQKRPVVLYVTEDGGADATDDPGPVGRIPAEGHSVFSVALRGLGIAAPRLPAAAPNYFSNPDRANDGFSWLSLALGLPAIGQRVWDILRAVDFLCERADIDPSQIRALGRGSAGIAVQFAGLLDGRIRSILLDRTPASYASLIESTDYSVRLAWFVPGILRHFDLPDVAAALSPRNCFLLNATDASGDPLSGQAIRESYRLRIGDKPENARHIRFIADTNRDPQEIYLDWIRTA